MRGSSYVNHRPYIPHNRSEEQNNPYICRLAPFATGFTFEWFDHADDGEHTLFYRKRWGDRTMTTMAISEAVITVNGLEEHQEYEFYIESKRGNRSFLRPLRTDTPPVDCAVINYIHPEDNQYFFSGHYFGSPTLTRCPSGKIVAGMDVFGNGSQNISILFTSEDNGKTWWYLTDMYSFFWSTLFVHKDVLYMLGLSTENGNLQIVCSHDEGKTWSAPVVIFYGSSANCPNGGILKAPMHLYRHKGRLYTTCEYGVWYKLLYPGIISIAEEDDPMIPENWVWSELLRYDGKWKEETGTQKDTVEANIIADRSGQLYSYMRWSVNKILRLKIDDTDPEAPPVYDGILDAEVSDSMFRIIDYKGRYYMITNKGVGRFILSLYVSDDLKHWELVKDIMDYSHLHRGKYGFQYPAFLAEEDGISLMLRSSFNEANNFHNANYMLFTKLDKSIFEEEKSK
ncbi:MAG: exo-alpha-sialidase [Clostridia bacterium]|nr:exo-alpha-sialidase [Clostridia bacterium]